MKKGKVKQIKDLLEALYSDTSVPPAKTRADLKEVRQEIDGLLDTLPESHVA